MKHFTKFFITGLAFFSLIGAASAADFSWGGEANAGYTYMKTGSTATKTAAFSNPYGWLWTNGKLGNVDGLVEISVSADGGVGFTQMAIVFHPGFLGGDDGFWKWGQFNSNIGWEDYHQANRKLISTSFAHGGTSLSAALAGGTGYPNQIRGTMIGKSFGAFNAEIGLTDDLYPTTFGAAVNKTPAFWVGAGFGDRESLFGQIDFGFSKETAASAKNGMLLDVTLGGQFNMLEFAAEFLLLKQVTTNFTFNIFADYMFNDDMGAGVRFDFGKKSEVGVALGLHYAINKNVGARFEYNLTKTKTAAAANGSWAMAGAGADGTNHAVMWAATANW